MDMWVGTRSAWHSKSLVRRCQRIMRFTKRIIIINWLEIKEENNR